ncbi:hypothetical protein J7355_13105 [Endozoicomonas sp. G2_2]|uniref:hypothetical protein n=1 Tax=Endozoicomonas sp. G2_2 TaxID=2821092 RepID=UPI001ADC9307|nr:hypothetical protein [Endozoicomonas sp. G2_2]MBO9471032.1 hypothetical protein [Endozoicomonas sp. G2_2]
MKISLNASYVLLCLLAVSTAGVAADSSDLDNAMVRMAGGVSGGLEAVSGWQETRRQVDGDTGTCISMGGNRKINRGTYCSGTVIWDRVTVIGKANEFGSFQDGDCPQGAALMDFSNGFRRSNGTLVPGPARICMKVN